MIIVTGGAGFIGSNIVNKLCESSKEEVVVVDTFDDKNKWKNIKNSNCTLFVKPVNLDVFLEEHKNKISIIVHMGAISSTVETDIDLIVETNINLSLKLWNFCKENDKRIIYASSAATYGNGENGYKDDEESIAKNELSPLNPYGWSKHCFDRIVINDAIKKQKLPKQYVGLKFFNVYGPNEYHKNNQKSMVANMYLSIQEKNQIKLFKSYKENYKHGEQVRDFVWVGDVVDVIFWFINNDNKNGIFNVGSGVARSFNDMAKIIHNVLEGKSSVEYIEMPTELRKHYQYYTKADISKLREYGYQKEFTSLECGIEKYVEYLREYDDFWK